MASSRLAYAVFCLGALLWVYCFTALVFFSTQKIMPKRGKFIVLLFLSSLICSVYLLLMDLLNPLLVAGAWFFLVLVPPCCMGSGFFELEENQEPGEILPKVALDALCLGLLIIAVSLIREPLGLGSLSFPGGVWGIREIVIPREGEGFFPIRILSVSAGGFFILGLGIAVFRYFRSQKYNTEDDQ
jgi:Na+-transporting NADH:ubiquinone oxidoreductase subunit NqrD